MQFKNFSLISYLAAIVLIVILSFFNLANSLFFGVKMVYLILIILFILTYFLNYLDKINYDYFKFNKESLQLNLIFFVPIIFVMLIFYFNGWYQKGDLSNLNLGIPYPTFPIFYVLISVPLQQSLIFGDLLNKLSPKFSKIIAIFASTVFYSLMHSFYPQPFNLLILTLVAGLIWAYISYRTRSIFGNLISHSIVGLLAMMMNLA